MVNVEAAGLVIANPPGPYPLLLRAQDPPTIISGHYIPPEIILMGQETNQGSSDRQDLWAAGIFMSILFFGAEFLRQGIVGNWLSGPPSNDFCDPSSCTSLSIDLSTS